MGSVKELTVQQAPSAMAPGTGRFVFTDDYSVFDWGKMPDAIPNKGASLCTMGAFNFERLEEEGISTHYRGVVRDGATVSLDDVSDPVNEMEIQLTRVPDLTFEDGAYNYEAYHRNAGDHYLIPLEIVFRNAVPVGSSLRRRTTPAEVGLDLDEWPDSSVELDTPVVEFSTKLEKKDRYLDRETAREISGLGDQFDELEVIARDVNRVITDRAESVGLSHEDGKIECVYMGGEIRVADVVGTFDENRFILNGRQISKEYLRQYYKAHDPDWVQAVGQAKNDAESRGISDWHALCQRTPDPLPERVIEVASDLYCAGTNEYTGRSWFESPSLEEVLNAL